MKKLIPFIYFCLVTAILTAQPNANLVANYTFHYGMVADSSIKNRQTTNSGATAVNDRFNIPSRALKFNSSAFVKVDSTKGLDFKSNFTLSIWVNFSNNLSRRPLLVKKNEVENACYGLWLEGNKVKFCVNPTSDSTTNICLLSTINLPNNKWNHISSSFDGSTMKLYLNGVLNTSKNWNGTIYSSLKPLLIGAEPSRNFYFIGALDDIKIYNTTLKEDEVLNLYTKINQDTASIKSAFSYISTGALSARFTCPLATQVNGFGWTFGDGTNDTIIFNLGGKIQDHTYQSAGRYNVCLTVYDLSYKTNTICKPVYIESGLPVGLNADVIDFNSSLSKIDDSTFYVTLTNLIPSNLQDSLNFSWDFGDGAISYLPNPAHTYKTGIYKVVLTVKGKKLDKVYNRTKIIKALPVSCNASLSYTAYDFLSLVQFNSKVSITSPHYFWSFGDGENSVLPNPKHSYSFPGIYNVVLVVKDDKTGCVDVLKERVNIGNTPCSAQFDYFVDKNKNDTLYLKNSSIGKADRLYWVFGDGAVSTKLNPKHKFSKPGMYTVSLTVQNALKNCIDKYEEKILIKGLNRDCEADFIFNTDSLKVSFSDISTGNNKKYIWNFGDTNIVYGAKKLIHTYKKSGIYNVCLTVVNDSGVSNMTCKKIPVATMVDKNCFADFIYAVDSVANAVHFLDKSPGRPTSFLWNFGDNTTATAFAPKHDYTKVGFYKVKLSIVTKSGCKASTVALVNVHRGDSLKAMFDYATNKSLLKASGYPVDFVGIAHGDAAKLKWTFGDGAIDTTSLNPIHLYQSLGIYTACLTIIDPITLDSSKTCQQVNVQTDLKEVTKENNFIFGDITVYPNPVKDVATIEYVLDEDADVEINVYNLNGVKVKSVVKEKQAKGKHTNLLQTTDLEKAVYFIQFKTAEYMAVEKITIE